MMDPRLTPYLPLRVVIRRYADGRLEGLTEESFNMNWSAYNVLIFWSGKAYSMLGETSVDAVADAAQHCKVTTPDLFTPEELVIDPLSDESPISMNLDAWLNATSKYNKRNAPFKVKGI